MLEPLPGTVKWICPATGNMRSLPGVYPGRTGAKLAAVPVQALLGCLRLCQAREGPMTTAPAAGALLQAAVSDLFATMPNGFSALL